VGCAQDRHVGQILARRMSRVEDLGYLEHLARESQHLDVRKAAQAQMARLRAHLGAARGADGAKARPSET
jgi:hypothetical protein